MVGILRLNVVESSLRWESVTAIGSDFSGVAEFASQRTDCSVQEVAAFNSDHHYACGLQMSSRVFRLPSGVGTLESGPGTYTFSGFTLFSMLWTWSAP